VFGKQKCEFSDLSHFSLQGGSEHQKPKSELMFDFTFSGSFSEENYKDQFFEVELNT